MVAQNAIGISPPSANSAPSTPTSGSNSPLFPSGCNSANYHNDADWDGQNGNVTSVGTNGGPSAYGTYDQSGNVAQWNDLDNTPGSSRGLRGGGWNYGGSSYGVSSAHRGTDYPSFETAYIGFRLASTLNLLSLANFVNVKDADNISDLPVSNWPIIGPINGESRYGKVIFDYKIGKYDVTNTEYAAFLNIIAKRYDNYGLYSANMGGPGGGITVSGSYPRITYTVKTNYEDKPVNFVSWFDCARYCNWLHNGMQSLVSSIESGAYSLYGKTSGNAVVSNPGARYYIPTENQWYKAAYYKGGSTTAGYWKYATQSDSDPTSVLATVDGNGILTCSSSSSSI